jgi:hypothetical protein
MRPFGRPQGASGWDAVWRGIDTIPEPLKSTVDTSVAGKRDLIIRRMQRIQRALRQNKCIEGCG